ncbi:MAG: hypothetical protein ACR2IH_05370 [Pyrinomonadaceae bacterium]
MATPKKRPSKNAKAALKAVKESKLLAATRAANNAIDPQEFKSQTPSPKTSAAIKARPDKKRG